MICKEKNDLCKRPFEVVWLYQATCLFIKFKDFGIVKLSWVTSPDEKYKGFQSGLTIIGDVPM
jgi:hypothetical protein